MNMLTIWHGAPTPIKVRGRNACALVAFAERNRGWHTLRGTRADRNALAVAMRAGCIETTGDQFRFTYPRINA